MDEFKRFNVKIDPLLGLLKLRKISMLGQIPVIKVAAYSLSLFQSWIDS